MTLNQKLAALLRRREFKGMHGQTSVHGCNRGSIQIFRDAVPGKDHNAWDPITNPLGDRSVLVADLDFDLSGWGGGQITNSELASR